METSHFPPQHPNLLFIKGQVAEVISHRQLLALSPKPEELSGEFCDLLPTLSPRAGLLKVHYGQTAILPSTPCHMHTSTHPRAGLFKLRATGITLLPPEGYWEVGNTVQAEKEP